MKEAVRAMLSGLLKSRPVSVASTGNDWPAGATTATGCSKTAEDL
jgi:hypothetical protein